MGCIRKAVGQMQHVLYCRAPTQSNHLAFLESAQTGTLYSGNLDENVLASVVRLNKTVALLITTLQYP